MSGYIQTNQILTIPVLGAPDSFNLTAADSGKTMAVAGVQAAVTIAPTNGSAPYATINALVYGALFNITSTQASAAGALAANEVVNAVVLKNAGNTVSLTAQARVGDFIDLNSDGIFWYVNGMSSNTGVLHKL